MNDAENTSPAQGSIARLLRPRSVAIIGASPTLGSLGASVLANLERFGFAGAIHLVNPRRSEIGGRPCLASADDLPEGVDCAVLAIPGAGVLDAMAACARRGVRAAIVFSAGFAEGGPEGRAAQQELARIAHAHGMAVEGPNCLGMVNYADGVALTFVDTPATRFEGQNGIAIVSQSGAMAAVVGVGLQARELGLSFSVSTGNEAVTGVEDYVEHLLLADNRTRVLAMIVEQFREPRRFLDLARAARRDGKLIVLLHPGRSAAARASAETHTGAMAGDYQLMRLKVEQAGVAVVDTLEELLDVSELFVRCPSLPRASAAVMTESGAFKALTLDFCERVGLALPALPPETKTVLRQALPEFIPPSNPLDLTAQGLVDPDLYRRTMGPLLAAEAYGSLVLGIILTNEATSRHKMPPIIAALEKMRPEKPVIFAALDEGAAVPGEFVSRLRRLGVPFFASPERAFTALARLADFASRGEPPAPDATPRLPGLELPRGTVPEHLSKKALAAVGVPVPKGVMVQGLPAALEAAAKIGFPVVLKAQSAALSHKSDAGGVVLGLADPAALGAGWDRLHADLARAKPGLVLDGVLIEGMAARGTELIVGARNDPDWGPILLVGLGGIWAEALRDVRLLPPDLSVEAVAAELGKLKGAALLRGVRGSPALDVAVVADIVSRIGTLVRAMPEIAEIDVNPVVIYSKGQGALALDALIVTR